ncbi:MAG: hypothetical protein ACQEQO_12365 [Thermodesulfobacteriota bacterium]
MIKNMLESWDVEEDTPVEHPGREPGSTGQGGRWRLRDGGRGEIHFA